MGESRSGEKTIDEAARGIPNNECIVGDFRFFVHDLGCVGWRIGKRDVSTLVTRTTLRPSIVPFYIYPYPVLQLIPVDE